MPEFQFIFRIVQITAFIIRVIIQTVQYLIQSIIYQLSIVQLSIVPNNIKKVAVLVNPENLFVENIKDQFDYLQLYETSPKKSEELKLLSNKKIIQAIKVKKKSDINLYSWLIKEDSTLCPPTYVSGISKM